VNTHKEEGVTGLRDCSSRPQRCPRQLARRYRREIERQRRRRWSSLRTARHLGLPSRLWSRSTGGSGSIGSAGSSRRWIVRHEYARPGALVNLDIKQLGNIGRR
jgi:hypothetical protein